MSSQTLSNPDWEPTLRSRNFLGCSDTSSPPAGTQLLCINNMVVPCSGDSNTNNKVVSLTILGVRSVGWSSVPWSKKGKTKKDAEKVQTKPLFEVKRYDGEPNREKVIGAVRVYSYQKEGGTDKGPREDSSFSVVEIGQVGCTGRSRISPCTRLPIPSVCPSSPLRTRTASPCLCVARSMSSVSSRTARWPVPRRTPSARSWSRPIQASELSGPLESPLLPYEVPKGPNGRAADGLPCVQEAEDRV